MDSPDASLSPERLLEHAAWIRKLAGELVQDPGAADDLAQETWLAFLRARPDTDRPLRPWLARVLRNAAALRARRRAGRVARETEVARGEALPSSQELVVRAEQQQRLVDAVLSLDDPYRSTVLLRYFEGLSPTEIGRRRGLPPATVRTHLFRGLERLRERLDEQSGGDRRAWVAMLQPLLPAPVVGPGLVALAAAALFVLLAASAGWWAIGDGGAVEPSALARGADAPGDPAAGAPSPGGAARRDEGVAGAAGPGAGVSVAATRALRLLDARTGDPLPAYAVELDGRLRVTDAEGRLEAPAAAASLQPVDDPRQAVDVMARHGAREREGIRRPPLALGTLAELPVESGPTFRLDLARSPGVALAELEALLAAEGLGAYGDDGRPRQVAPVRAPLAGAASPWVRFAGAPSGAGEPGARWHLELRDLEGLWRGVAPLADPMPLGAPRIPVELRPTAVVEGRVSGLLEGGLEAAVVALRERSSPPRLVDWTRLDAEGGFALRWIAPGAYELSVEAPLTEAYAVHVELHGGAHLSHDVALEPLRPAGALAGIVTSSSGDYRGQLLVFLLDAGGRTLGVYPTTWREDEQRHHVAPFEFADVPTGALRLDVVSLQDAVTFRVSPVRLAAPDENVSVTVLDERPAADWSFEVVDAESGAPIRALEVEARVDDGVARRYRGEPLGEGDEARRWTLIAGGMQWNRFEGRAPLRRLPADARLAWTVRAEGYAPVSGDSADFEYRGDGLRVARVALRRP